MLDVLSVLLDAPEGISAESCQLKYNILSLWSDALVNI
jgi:hypothetical protein